MIQFISRKTFQRLKGELQELKSKRKELAATLGRTAGFGDLAENAEYQQAREEKELLDRKIFDLEQKLRNAKIREKKNSNNKVGLYSRVKARNKDSVFYIILVPPEEIDLSEKKISVKSPLGRSFLGKKKDDIVEVKTPSGKEVYKILEIE